jgi:hypothetical protein
MSYQYWQNDINDVEAIIFPSPFKDGDFAVSINYAAAEGRDTGGVFSSSLCTLWGLSHKGALKVAEPIGLYWDIPTLKIEAIAAWRIDTRFLHWFPTGDCRFSINIHTLGFPHPSSGFNSDLDESPRTFFNVLKPTNFKSQQAGNILSDLTHGPLRHLLEIKRDHL